MRAFEEYVRSASAERSAVVVIVIERDDDEMSQLVGAYYDIDAPDEDLPVLIAG